MNYLDDAIRQMRKLKTQADRAIAQIGDKDLTWQPDPESNSVAVIVKHIAGNLRSRWTNFLTSDGEKPDRQRDGEFEVGSHETRASILARWEEGWRTLFETLGTLGAADLDRTITIRGEAHSVFEAINRQMTHYAAHVGQIVYLCKHRAGRNWKTLSIPRGKSRDFDVSKDGNSYRAT